MRGLGRFGRSFPSRALVRCRREGYESWSRSLRRAGERFWLRDRKGLKASCWEHTPADPAEHLVDTFCGPNMDLEARLPEIAMSERRAVRARWGCGALEECGWGAQVRELRGRGSEPTCS